MLGRCFFVLFLALLCCRSAFLYSRDVLDDPQSDDSSSQRLERYEYSEQKMGVPVRVVLYAENKEIAERVVKAVWERFDELNEILSDYDPESETIQVCRKLDAGNFDVDDRATVSEDLRRVLEESRRYCEITEGAFDVTVGPIVKLWRRSAYFHKRPPEDMLLRTQESVGLKAWSLDERGLKTREGTRFDFGGIGKGIALDSALDIARSFGVESILIDASGDIRVGAAPPGKEGWNIAVASLNQRPLCYCELANAGICSSGDANRWVEIDGVRYSHIIDPRTYEPLTRRCVSAVIAPTATTADAFASALCVLGGEEFSKIVADRARGKDYAQRDGEFFLEYALVLAKDDAEPPYEPDEIDVFATALFEKVIKQSDASENDAR